MSPKQFSIALVVMAFMAAGGGFAAVGLFLDITPAHADADKTVSASAFELVDASGAKRCVIGVGSKGDATFTLLDPSGRARLRLSADDQGGRVALLDSKGTTRCILAQSESNDRVRLVYSDAGGHDRWLSALTREGDCLLSFNGPQTGKWMTLMAGPEQASTLLLMDPKTKQMVTSFAGRGQATLQLSDADGNSGYMAATLKDGRSVFALSNSGKLRVRGMTKADGSPELLFYDENRSPVWTAGK